MAATTEVWHPRGGGWLVAIVMVVAALVLLSGGLAMGDDAAVPAADLPAPAAPNAHAVETHLEAQDIYARYQSKQYSCLRVYRQVQLNRILWLFTYSDNSLWGGMFTTVSGSPVTAFVARPEYWIGVICAGYTLVTWEGQCPEEVGCK